MTRKHYIRTAEILRETLPDSHVRLPVAQAFADMFAAENGRFDRFRFIHAVETGEGLSRASNLAAEVAAEQRVEALRKPVQSAAQRAQEQRTREALSSE